ncbi:phage tail protein [Escherichia coli]
MAIQGLEQAVENRAVSAERRCLVPPQWPFNRVASSAISQSASQVARETKVRRKLVKERARLKGATVKNPQARIRVNRGDLPVIKLGNARVVLSRRRRRKKGAAFIPERWRQRACWWETVVFPARLFSN